MNPPALDLAIAALEKAVSRLESSIDSLEKWLWISSAAVAIGVVLELYFLSHEYLSDRREWLKGFISSPPKPSLKLLLFEMASVLVVVAGVVGELGVGVLSANKNTELRNVNNQLVSLVREKAGLAEKDAGDANKSAGAARQDAANTALRAGKLEKEAAALRLKADNLEESRLRMAREFIELSARGPLIEDARDEMQKALELYKGQKIEVVACLGTISDIEIHLTDNALTQALLRAGWNVSRAVDEPCGSGTGIRVSTADPPLKSALSAADAVVLIIQKVLWVDFHPEEYAAINGKACGACLKADSVAIRVNLPTERPLAADTVRLEVYSHPPLKSSTVSANSPR